MSNVTPFMKCDQVRHSLQAAPFNATPPVGIEKHLRGCPHCREVALSIHRLDANLRHAWAEESVPAELWQRVLRTIDADNAQSDAAAARRSLSVNRITWWRLPRPDFARLGLSWRPVAGGLVAIFLIVVAGLITGPYGARHDGEILPLIREPVNDLITYRLSRRPLDIASSDPRDVADWFAGKVDFLLPQPATELAGYRLVGSRLCYFLDRRLSALMYQRGDHFVSLYIMSKERLELPSGVDERIADWRITVHEHKGYTSFVWHEGSLAFALVSDLSRRDLLRAADDLRRAWVHARETRLPSHGAPDLDLTASERGQRAQIALFMHHADGRLGSRESIK